MKRDILNAARLLHRDMQKHRWTERKRKKDAVLHLRIEGGVMDRIKAEAKDGDMSVSDVIRGYLAERFAETGSARDFPAFLRATSAFSDVTVLRSTRCAACDAILGRGAKARVAHGPFPGSHLVCGKCHDSLQRQLDEQDRPLSGEQ